MEFANDCRGLKPILAKKPEETLVKTVPIFAALIQERSK